MEIEPFCALHFAFKDRGCTCGYPFPAEIFSHGVWHLEEVFVKIRGKLLRSLINQRDNESV